MADKMWLFSGDFVNWQEFKALCLRLGIPEYQHTEIREISFKIGRSEGGVEMNLVVDLASETYKPKPSGE